jgi:alanyl-tRNA synthetase (EC 6.1.1.7)
MLGIKNAFLEGAVDAVLKIHKGVADFEALEKNISYIKKLFASKKTDSLQPSRRVWNF